MGSKDHAIVIGIRTYPNLQSLRGPCHDATMFREWLLDPAGGDVPEDQVKFLITDEFPDPDVTDHPNVTDMNKPFRELHDPGVLAARSNESLGRRLYIYLAGHGFSEIGNMRDVALSSADATLLSATNLAATKWAEWFRINGVFDEIVLIMDCCRTTSSTSSISAPPVARVEGSTRRGSVRRFYAFAVTDGQPAREQPDENGEWGGIFTRALLDALANARSDDQGRVCGQQLQDHVHSNLVDQPPEFDVPPSQRVVFAYRPHGSNVPVELRIRPADGAQTIIISDDVGAEVMRTPPVDEEFVVHLQSGVYKAAIDGNGRSKLFKVPSDHEIVI